MSRGYADPEELRATSRSCASASAPRTSPAAPSRRLLWQVDVFGFHLASLDVRQSAGVVREAVGRAAARASRAPATSRRGSRCSRRRSRPVGAKGFRPPDGPPGELLRVLDTIALARDAYGRRRCADDGHLDGRAAVGRARGAVARPARGAARPARARRELRFVPLFETLADLEGAPATMETLYACAPYRDALRWPRRPPVRDARLLGLGQGLPASSPASGRCTARSSGSRGRRASAGLALELFHGRGGSTVARRRAHVPRDPARSRPGPLHGRMRITEQGETISARYGHPELAVRSLEQTRRRCCWPPRRRRTGSPSNGAGALDRVAARSREVYRALIYEDAGLPALLRADHADRGARRELNIGSRPPSRARTPPGIEALRAIPWVFAWTQNRLLLPSWYGAGHGARGGRP